MKHPKAPFAIELPAGHSICASGPSEGITAIYAQMPARCTESMFIVLATKETLVAGHLDPYASWEKSIPDMAANLTRSKHPKITEISIVIPQETNIFKHFLFEKLKRVKAKGLNINLQVGPRVQIDLKTAKIELLPRRLPRLNIVQPCEAEKSEQLAHIKDTHRYDYTEDACWAALDSLRNGGKLRFPEDAVKEYIPLRNMQNISQYKFLKFFTQK